MEVADALHIPLEPAQVREALGDLALVRASIDNCESLVRLAGGEYTLRLTDGAALRDPGARRRRHPFAAP